MLISLIFLFVVRRIISAMMQHITYTDFLPRLLGAKMIKESSLSENFQYDPSCDATIFNEFSTAAYRLGHTLLKPMLKRMTSGYKISSAKKSIRLRTAFFNPDVLYESKTFSSGCFMLLKISGQFRS